jgi:hypothetical protein
MNDGRKGTQLGEYIEEGIEANTKVNRLRKLPKLTAVGRGEKCFGGGSEFVDV